RVEQNMRRIAVEELEGDELPDPPLENRALHRERAESRQQAMTLALRDAEHVDQKDRDVEDQQRFRHRGKFRCERPASRIRFILSFRHAHRCLRLTWRTGSRKASRISDDFLETIPAAAAFKVPVRRAHVRAATASRLQPGARRWRPDSFPARTPENPA